MMRIIGGEFRNRLLKSPKGERTRPTSALLRKALFDICKEYIQDAVFLDLFAGTGAMGIEALSRGAAHATFIDSDKMAIRCIHENLAALGLEKNAAVYMGHLPTPLKKLKKVYDLVYIDSPYDLEDVNAEILTILDEGSLLAKDAVVFVEVSDKSKLDLTTLPLKHLRYIKTRNFGKSLLHHYCHDQVAK